MNRSKGFTLVELVMVIVLLGIVSISAMSLFASRSGFSASLAKDQLLSTALLAQQRALGTHLSDASGLPIAVSLAVNQTADSWLLTVSQGGTTFTTQRVERAGASLSINGAALSDGAGWSLSFDQRANTASQSALVIAGDTTYTVCIAATGFAYEGVCQ